jgi:hypothetical protein
MPTGQMKKISSLTKVNGDDLLAKKIKKCFCQMWWHTPAIPALKRLKQENHKFKASLGCI